MIASARSPFVIGRFPPPMDGQTIATEQLAALLAEALPVRRLNLSAPEAAVAFGARFRPERVLHYAASARRLRQALAAGPEAPVLWTSISPSVLGHTRDRLITVPAFRNHQPVYAVVHHGDFDALFTRRATRWSADRVVQRLAGVVFLTRTLSEACAPWIPPGKRFVIPNTILSARVSAPAEVAEKQHGRARRDHLRVLFVSNMIPSKGYDDLVVALHLLRLRGAEVEARFVGRWPSEGASKSFQARVNALGLSDAVEHLGPIRDDAIMRGWYLWADAFVLPTYYPTEAQPLVLLEALAAGTPVVTTRRGGIPEMIEDGVEGALVPPRQPEAIAQALDSLRDVARWHRQSAAARAHFVNTFSHEVVRRQWIRLLADSYPAPALSGTYLPGRSSVSL